jgi:YidC/Oxa1 family membrane protein insertase
MENRRLFSFLLTSMAFLWLWTAVIQPKFFPVPVKKPAAPLAAEATDSGSGSGSGELSAAGTTNEKPASDLVIPDHPLEQVILGSSDPESGYALNVDLTSAGAAVASVSLTAPQYKDLQDRKVPARIVGNNLTDDKSFSTAILVIDRQLASKKQTLESANWKLVEKTETDTLARAIFEYDAPDGTLRVRKTFSLPRLKVRGKELVQAWHSDPSFYTVEVALEVINLSDSPRTFDYEIQGPVGVLFENEEHTSKYRDLHLEFVDGTKAATLPASTVVDYCDDLEEELGRPSTLAEQKNKLREDHEWTSAFRYAGIDVQFFAALVAPLDDRTPEEQAEKKWLDRTYPVLIARHPDDRTPEEQAERKLLEQKYPVLIPRHPDDRTPEERAEKKLLERKYPVLIPRYSKETRKSDISLRMASMPIVLQAKNDSVVHKYAFFVGPKHRELLDPLPFQASQVLNYGMFGFVARIMHYLLDTFFTLGMPYYLAIVSLTVLVRGCLFPLSRKQAIMAARQKELQPQLTLLKEKYADDKEKLARAQMEMWRKNGINPLSGCLPLFLQLPIFVGLYTALNSAVDLRLQSFLWIENLAGPDALFRLPFALPFGLGADFSILPLCTVALFLTQQKMFMPPAQDEQQEMQYKMMNMMTGVMGIMFWHQPAGLCLYFIASSVWSIAERKLLGTGKLTPAGPAVEVIMPDQQPTAKSAKNTSAPASAQATAAKPPGFLQRLLDAAAEAQKNAEQQREKSDKKGKNNGKKK